MSPKRRIAAPGGRRARESRAAGARAPWLAAPLALGVLLACAAPVAEPPDPLKRQEAAERAQRQRAAAVIAPLPLSAASPSAATPLPLAGPEGRDADGYPTQYVDRAAVRSLLLHRRYAELTDVVERLQAEFEDDPRKEYWPNDAAEALGTGEAELEPFLQEWVRASPRSFAPLLARGVHWVNRGYERRGGKWASETPDESFSSMASALGRAIFDLELAVRRRPRLVAAMRQELNAFLPFPFGHRWNRRIVDRALERCPSCFQIRATYLHTLTPRWGGSYEAMGRFLARSPGQDNPRNRLLPGYVYLHLSDDLRAEGRLEEALTATERACEVGEHWEFLLERARARLRLDQDDAALPDLARAERLRPGHPDVLFEQAYALGKVRRWEEAAARLKAGIRVEPTHWRARSLLANVVKGLAYEGWQRHEAGDRTTALRLYDLAAELAPEDREVQGRRAYLIAGPETTGAAVQVPEVVPDDFRTVQQLDYRLARQGRFERILPLWDTYLARHPEDGRAYLERSGTLFHLRRMAESRADGQKACDLGMSEGCVWARKLAAAR